MSARNQNLKPSTRVKTSTRVSAPAKATFAAGTDGRARACAGDTQLLFGATLADIEESPLAELFATPVQEHVTRMLRQSGGHDVDITSVVKGPSNSPLPVSVSISAKETGNGQGISISIQQVHEHPRPTCDLAVAARELGSATDAATIVERLARLTGADICFFGSFTDDSETRLRTTAVFADGQPGKPMEYDLAGTPCAKASDTGHCCAFPSHVRECFPDSELIAQNKVEAYIGAPLHDRQGNKQGLIVTIFHQPLDEISDRTALVELFGQKAAMFIEQTRSDDKATLFQSVVDYSHAAVLVVETGAGHIVEANASVADLLGYEREELTDLSIRDIDKMMVSDEDLTSWMDKAASQDGFLQDAYYRRRDGSFCTVEITARTSSVADRNYVVIGLRDISANRQAEEALRESEQRFRALVEHSSDVVTMLDADGRIIYISPAIKHVLGHQPSDLLGELFINRVEPSQREDFEASYRKWTLEPRTTFAKYFEWQDADGTNRHIAARVCNQIDEPAVQAIVINMRDVTDRIQASTQMKRQADLINQAAESIAVCNLSGQILSWNKGAQSLYGYSTTQVFGKTIAEVGVTDPEVFEKALASVKESGSWAQDISFRDQDGTERFVHCRWSLLRNEHGVPDEILMIDSDFTEQKRIEHQLLRHQRMESVGTLASGIAHDLNNILMPILMLTTTLRRHSEDADDCETLDMIIQSAQRGADIVKQVLTYVRGAEGSRMYLKPQNLVKELVHLVKETFPKHLQLKHKSSDCDWLINGNMTELNQVLLNLAVNARDACPAGGTLRLELECTKIDQHYADMHGSASPGEYMLFRVGDNGSGMGSEHLERIFDPFFTTKPQGEGTGLGLATVRGIVESHDGFIDVQSELGSGSEFRVYIPAITDTQAEAHPNTPVNGFADGNGQTVLVVDDELPIQKTLRRMLERSGYQVIVAQNGTEGISKYAAQRDEIDVIVTDVTMPELNGVEFVKIIKNMNPDTKVIVSSGRLVDDVAEQFRGFGVTDMLAKPYSAQDLLGCLEKVLNS